MEGKFTLGIMQAFVFAAVIINAKECEYSFVFPTLSGSVVTDQENTKIILPFNLRASCGIPDELTVKVAKRDKESWIRDRVCQITHRDGQCYVHEAIKGSCKCLEGEGKYMLTKRVQMNDNGLWVWWTDENYDREQELIFNIQSSSSGLITPTATTLQTHRRTEFTTRGDHDVTRFTRFVTKAVQPDAIETDTTSVTTSNTESYSEAGDGTPVTESEGWLRRDETILGCVGIVAFAAIVITIIVQTRRGRGQPGSKAPTSETPAIEDDEAGREDRPPTPPYHLYWEILDDFPPPSPGAPVFPPPAPETGADGYLVPSPLRDAGAGADNRECFCIAPLPSDNPDYEPYERPDNPDYATPSAPYEPLRHLYNTIR